MTFQASERELSLRALIFWDVTLFIEINAEVALFAKTVPVLSRGICAYRQMFLRHAYTFDVILIPKRNGDYDVLLFA